MSLLCACVVSFDPNDRSGIAKTGAAITRGRTAPPPTAPSFLVKCQRNSVGNQPASNSSITHHGQHVGPVTADLLDFSKKVQKILTRVYLKTVLFWTEAQRRDFEGGVSGARYAQSVAVGVLHIQNAFTFPAHRRDWRMVGPTKGACLFFLSSTLLYTLQVQ